MQMLLMLKQTVESPDRKQVLNTGDGRSLVDLGTFFDLIHGHRQDVSLELSLSWDLPESLRINNPEKQTSQLYELGRLSFQTKIREESARAVVETFTYELDSQNRFGMTRKNGSNKAGKDQYDLITEGYNAKRVPGRVWPLPAPAKCYAFPDEAVGYFQNTGFLPDFVLSFEQLFSRVAYLGPLREYPERRYVWAGDSPVDVGRNGQLAVHALLASRIQGPTISLGRGKKKRTVQERIAEWLREMGLIHSFSLEPIGENRKDYEVQLKKTPSSPKVLITDVGFGVSQILPVLVLCYYVPEGSVILLEQPEIHLHPAVQAALADVLIEVVTKRKVQIIVESHSEHLLRRLQRRIAEEHIESGKVALYFCRADDAESRIDELHLDLLGHIANWPKDFFGDERGYLLAMTEAEVKRRAVGQR
jgi:AAA ATPase domain/Protein of unknown function (DUF3696)